MAPAAVRDTRPPFDVDGGAHDWHRSQEYIPVGAEEDGDGGAAANEPGAPAADWQVQAMDATQSSRQTAQMAMARNRGSGGLW